MSGEQPQDYPPAEEWMRKAADDIDIKLGLPRHDQAPEWCARIIARHYQGHLAHLKVLDEHAAIRQEQIAQAAAQIVEARAEEVRRELNQPSRMDMELAVEKLAESERGRAVMLGLLKLLDDHALGLDYQGQKAVVTLLHSAWGSFAGSTRDYMRDTLETPPSN